MEYSPSIAIFLGEDMKYIDRGDPASPDFTLSVLINDNAWHELDLSSVVPPAGASNLVHLRVTFVAPGEAIEGWIRENGNVNTENAERYITRAEGTDSRAGLVTMDADRKIEYKIEPGMSVFNIVIRGWVEG